MIRSKPLLAALCATTALLTGGAKPAPQPTAFTPALSYLYNGQEIRLANADGSAAALLVRIPTGSQAYSILYHALAPLGQRQAAFVETPSNTVKTLRLVSWTQPTPGGPLSVTLDPTPLFTLSGYGAQITSLDFSPDGSRLAIVSSQDNGPNELRIFDLASRTQIGDPFAFTQFVQFLRWRSSDDSLLLRGEANVSSWKDGLQTVLFADDRGVPLDTFNAGSPQVMFANHQPGGALQLWDGVSVLDGVPQLATISDGIDPSISCDNARMIFTRLAPRMTVVVRTLATGAEREFSRDRGIRFPLYPGAC